MPSTSLAQHRLMAMAAAKPGGYRGISRKTGEDFIRADRGKHFKNHHDHAKHLARGMHKRLAQGHGR